MPSFVMLTRLNHEALKQPNSLVDLSHEVTRRIKTECPGVEWDANYTILGPADYLDIFSAPDVETAMKVATIIRMFGHADTEIWTALEWDRFVELARSIPSAPKP
ncbi:GYD domain-containing protein [Pseudaminobacter sp. 19-2017]|uniref:GYD domain-containing protein n=1 Tax=Pseudaminobacter soli (ex Zhang et al. 2022) TaxID=2831468 RepID=A0A942I2N3_9HYPH|nr:GYD domain-containing protein [Pseudaminobacter soli]MBS3648664.1 GYD domain-containing protein [Pseudaminobacter soli]